MTPMHLTTIRLLIIITGVLAFILIAGRILYITAHDCRQSIARHSDFRTRTGPQLGRNSSPITANRSKP